MYFEEANKLFEAAIHDDVLDCISPVLALVIQSFKFYHLLIK